MNIKSIMINKNRGWRGLAEIRLYNDDRELISKTIFSFSQEVWDDLMSSYIVVQDKENYYVLEINHTDSLPQGHQRSVLIKNFKANVTKLYTYKKTDWKTTAPKEYRHYNAIVHFKRNKNNHTTSDWNCIGLRVIPRI